MAPTTKLTTAAIAMMLALGVWLSGAPAATAQDGDGVTTVTATGNGASKNQARDDALRKAVEQGAGVVITSRTESLNHSVAYDKIVSRADGFVKNFTVAEEKKDTITDMWAVTITAQVATGKIKDEWGKIQLLLDRKGQPTVMVLVRETIRNEAKESVPSATAYCASSMEKLMLDKGFRVKSAGGLKEKERRARDAAVVEEDVAQLAAIARNYGANIVVTGDMTCRFDKETNAYGVKFRRYLATATLTAYRSDTADLLASVQVSGLGSAGGDAEAQELALKKAAADVGDEVLKELLNQWYFEFQQGQRFELQVSIVAADDDAKKMRKADRFSLKFQQTLGEIDGVKEVVEDNYNKTGTKAVATIVVKSTLTKKDLQLAIGDLETDTAGYWLEYTGGDKGSLRYTLHIE